MTICIEVEHLSHSYQNIPALNGISFLVNCGEIFGFLGPNGAGKSTTIRILSGQIRPTSGTARVFGYDVVKERAFIKTKIGLVFEFQNVYDRLSARDNLLFSARLYGAPRSRVDQILAQVGLVERSKERVSNYSNGMRQRLMIARALIHQPDLLFLDEPTRGLDPNIAREIHGLVKDLVNNGMTVFLTTHYMEEADRLCNRVAFINSGKIVALDTPQKLKEIYGNSPQATLEDVFVKLTGNYLRV